MLNLSVYQSVFEIKSQYKPLDFLVFWVNFDFHLFWFTILQVKKIYNCIQLISIFDRLWEFWIRGYCFRLNIVRIFFIQVVHEYTWWSTTEKRRMGNITHPYFYYANTSDMNVVKIYLNYSMFLVPVIQFSVFKYIIPKLFFLKLIHLTLVKNIHDDTPNN